jgi:hypothetical protein
METAPEGEDLACDDWSEDEQNTPPHGLSGFKAKVALAAVRGDKTLAESTHQDVRTNQITDWRSR